MQPSDLKKVAIEDAHIQHNVNWDSYTYACKVQILIFLTPPTNTKPSSYFVPEASTPVFRPFSAVFRKFLYEFWRQYCINHVGNAINIL